MARIVLDLRWVRETTLDGIARVSLSYVAELLRTSHPNHTYYLLFTHQELKQFCLLWIQQYSKKPLVADFFSKVCGYDARSWKNRVFLYRELKGFQPHFYVSFYYIFHPMPGINLAMVHDLTPLHYPQYFQQASPLFRLLLCQPQGLKWLLHKADYLLTVSHHTRQDLIELAPEYKDKTAVIPLAASPCPEDVGPAPLSSPYLLQVGRADPHKNQLGLLRAYAQLSPDLQARYALVFAGPDDERYTPLLTQEIQKQQLTDRVHLTGALSAEALHAYYHHASLLIMPSFYEGFGLPVLEAMQHHTPTLLARVASLPEVGGTAAAYFDPHHPEDLTLQLNALLNAPIRRQALAQAGQLHAQKSSWSHTSQRFLKLLQDLHTP